MGLPLRHREGRRSHAGGGGAGGGRARDAARLRVLVVPLGDPPAHDRARRDASRELPPRPDRAGAPLARDGGGRGGSVPRRPRRGRRRAVARGGPLRRLPRDPDPLAGHGSREGRDRRRARGPAEAQGHRRAQRPAGAGARGPGADGLRSPRRGAGRRRGVRGGRAVPRRPPQGAEDGPLPRPAREPPRGAPVRARARARRLHLRRRLRPPGGAPVGRGHRGRSLRRGAGAREGQRRPQRHRAT